MIKALTIPICVSILLATAFKSSAQSDTSTAINEAVRRQADRITLRQRLADARVAEDRHDLSTAAKNYDEAWTLIEGIGPGVEAEVRQTVMGLTQTRMQLAKEAQSRGDYREAKADVDDVLRVNGHDNAAQEFKAKNDALLETQKRFTPNQDVIDRIPALQKDREQAAILVQDARVLLQNDKFDEADAKLKQALKLDSGNETIVYYSSLVQQARFKRSIAERNLDSETKIVQVESAWKDSSKRANLPSPNPMARTNLINTSPERQAIMSKLDSIRLDNFEFQEAVPLSEVIRTLSAITKKRDPNNRGINFLINSSPSASQSVTTTPITGLGGPGGGFGADRGFTPPPQQLTDPATGLPIVAQAPQAEQLDLNNDVHVRINPGLTDIRLADALDAIVTVADHPIKYSIKDYAVEFSSKGNESAPLTSRRFKVDPNTFQQGLESVEGFDFASTAQSTTGGGGGGSTGGSSGGGSSGGSGGQNGQGGSGGILPRVTVAGTTGGGGGGGRGGGQGGGQQGGQNGQAGQGQTGQGITGVTSIHNMSFVQTAVIAFFRAEGVDLNPPKSVFFNDREGSLWVRATTEDLDIIEQAIQTLNVAPPQVNIRVKFVEITQNDSKALGFDWYLGNFNIGGQAVGSGGTQPSLTGAPTTVNPEGTFPGSALFGTATAPAASDGLLTSGLRNTLNAPAVGTITGILTNPQFKMVLHALQQRDGVDQLTDGEVTTLSGRQTQFQAVDLRYIVTSSGVNQGGGGAAPAGNGGNTVLQQSQQSITPGTSVVPLGPTIDVVPYVSADGYTVQMTLIPTLVEFLGYDDPGQFVIQAQQGAGVPITAVLPLPHFRLRSVTTSCIVWDGQTVVLGGLISDNVTRVKDQLPVLGDLPFVGRLFRSEQNMSTKQNLLIFVTPTILDPAGNRVHSDDDLPFSQNSFPTSATNP